MLIMEEDTLSLFVSVDTANCSYHSMRGTYMHVCVYKHCNSFWCLFSTCTCTFNFLHLLKNCLSNNAVILTARTLGFFTHRV